MLYGRHDVFADQDEVRHWYGHAVQGLLTHGAALH